MAVDEDLFLPEPAARTVKYWGHLPAHELPAMCSEDAAALYRHPSPQIVQPS